MMFPPVTTIEEALGYEHRVQLLLQALPGLKLSKPAWLDENSPTISLQAFDPPVKRPQPQTWDSYLTESTTALHDSDLDTSISSVGSAVNRTLSPRRGMSLNAAPFVPTQTPHTCECAVDVPELYESDAEWPDFSRWSHRRRSSDESTLSSLKNSVECTVDIVDEEVLNKEISKPIIAAESPQQQAQQQLTALHPAKTGFALWVGNLSPRTTLPDLCELFGTPELQSIYLIQRTGCAFVNYTDEKALMWALDLFSQRGGRLHDHDLVTKLQICGKETGGNEVIEPQQTCAKGAKTRYFVCKSLTVSDLEQAKKCGKWSTQLRNMDRLNEAFHTSEHTLLVFSANRTSAYYGIARLDTAFTEQENDDVEVKALPLDPSALPKITPTLEFHHPQDGVYVPPGEIVLDPLRGSQFWKVAGCACVEAEAEKWTAPAKITWLSPYDSVVPFCQTRQLRNSLNGNKPIKVARDGTEIDPVVGCQLCDMFK